MITYADITNHNQIRELLQHLRDDTQPLWGKMTAQQMIEHLIDAVRYTNGTLQPTCNFTTEVAQQRKQRAKENDNPMPRNFDSGYVITENQFPDKQSAVGQLLIELQQFDLYFKQPGIEAIHGGFGPLNYEEWIWWHNKHFTHHFTQFGLIAE